MLLPSGLQENRLAKTCSISPRVGRTSSLFVFRRCQSLKSMATGRTHQLQTCLRLQLWSLSLALLTWLRNTFFSFKARGARLSLVSFSSVAKANCIPSRSSWHSIAGRRSTHASLGSPSVARQHDSTIARLPATRAYVRVFDVSRLTMYCSFLPLSNGRVAATRAIS